MAFSSPPGLDPGRRPATRALTVAGALVAGLLLAPVTAAAAACPDQPVTGELTDGTTWGSGCVVVLSGTVSVPAGATLTVGSGAVVKAQDGAGLAVAGSLVVDGTAAAPAVLTSLRDDTVGGDTNGDGAAGAPTAGAWAGVSSTGRSASLTLQGADIRWASVGVTATGARTLDVSASTVRRSSGDGIVVTGQGPDEDGGSGTARVTSNRVLDSGGVAVRYSGWGIDAALADLAGNRGVRNAGGNFVDLELFEVRGADTWPTTSGANGLPLVVGSLQVGDSAALTVPAGSWLKFADSGSSLAAYGGTIDLAGTANRPVVLTSLADDTVGGNTDGVSRSPQPGDWQNVYVEAGTLTAAHVDNRYAGTGFDGRAAAVLSITDSTVRSADAYGIFVDDSYGSLSTPSRITLTGNTVRGARYSAISISGRYPDGSLDVSPERLAGNRGIDNGQDIISLSNWTVRGDVTINPPAVDPRTLPIVLGETTTVPAGSSLTFPGRSVTKFYRGAEVVVDGRVTALATPTCPVYLTATADDTVGGDIEKNGPTTPAADHWQGLRVGDAGTGVIELNGAEVRYAG